MVETQGPAELPLGGSLLCGCGVLVLPVMLAVCAAYFRANYRVWAGCVGALRALSIADSLLAHLLNVMYQTYARPVGLVKFHMLQLMGGTYIDADGKAGEGGSGSA